MLKTINLEKAINTVILPHAETCLSVSLRLSVALCFSLWLSVNGSRNLRYPTYVFHWISKEIQGKIASYH